VNGPLKNTKIKAVLTGDVVKSTRLSTKELSDTRERVLAAIDEISRWADGLVIGKPEFFRGDSWQVLVGDPRYFLRISIFIRAYLRRFNKEWDTRIAIGLGTVDQIELDRISLSSGSAFISSGKELDAMSSSLGFAVRHTFDDAKNLGWIEPLAALCSASVNHWSERQANMMCHMLPLASPTQTDLAAELQISKQAVNKALQTGDFDPVMAAIDWMEGFEWQKQKLKQVIRMI
jgi:hypothetical protein